MKKDREQFPFGEALLAYFRDPDHSLPHDRAQWEETRNPYYVWEAIKTCGEHKREFPDWVRDYLIACAKRMLSPESARSKDYRTVLPSILGFAHAKRGPGHPLQPRGNEESDDYMCLAHAFSIEIQKTERPADALGNALNSTSARWGERLQDKDDKTLKTNIAKYYGMKRVPRTADEWRRIIYLWHVVTFGPLLKDLSEK